MEDKIDCSVKEIAHQKLERIIKNEFNFHLQEFSKEETILQVYQNLLVGVLVGQSEVVQTFSVLCQNLFQQNGVRHLSQTKFLEWVCSSQIKNFLFQLIQKEYDGQQKNTIHVIQQIPHSIFLEKDSLISTHVIKQENCSSKKQTENNRSTLSKEHVAQESNIFEVINLCDSQVEEEIYESHNSPNNQILIYTDEQIRREINLEFEQISNKQHLQPSQQFKQFSTSKEQHPNSLYLHSQVVQEELIEHKPLILAKQIQLFDEESVLEDSKDYGHFLYGDKIEEILQVFYQEDLQYLVVKWKARKDGTTLKDSVLPSQTLKQHSPQQLITFYEQLFWNST